MTWPDPVRLATSRVALEPLCAGHVPALAEAVRDGALWRLWYTPVPHPDAMAAEVERRLRLQAEGAWLPFAVVDLATGLAVGMTNYLHPAPIGPRLEIGGTWYRKSAQGTGVNAACKRLLLGHAFEVLGCTAVELRTHAMNRQSRGTIEGLGAKLDGVLRNHFDQFGRLRDTCVYSIIAGEWPVVRGALDWRLENESPPASGA